MKSISIIIVLFLVKVANCQDGFIKGQPALAYWELGDNQDVVVVLHGGPGASHSCLRPEFDALSDVARVIYYDQRSCGKSEKSSRNYWQDYMEDLRRVIHSVSNKKKVFLAASSWGCYTVLLYSYHYPQDLKGIILSGTVEWKGEGLDLSEIEFAKPDEDSSKTYNFKIFEDRLINISKDPESKKYDTIEVRKNCYVDVAIPFVNSTRSLKSAPPLNELKNINIPVLIFKGSKADYRDWAENYKTILPNSSLVTIDLAGHDPWFSNPELFFNEAKKFILENK